MYKFGTAVLLITCLVTSGVFAQKQISGKVADAKTGEPLPSAHVIIKGTYKGTITNADGEYRLNVSELPATIMVRFIGFETQEKSIDVSHSGPLDFLLKESVTEMPEIVVTGEDPAISIMREVIRRKQIWRAQLNTYTAEAYSRQQLRNDTTIVSITESVSQVFWDKERGTREVLKSRRQTANMDAADNFAGVSYMPNFYDDNLDIAGFDMVGVTHPDALKYYDFKLEDIESIDDKAVYEISVSSKRKLQPLFEGTIHVLDEEYAVLSVDLKPNSVVVFPAPIQDLDLSYKQQFSNFGGDFWLPVDVRIDGFVKVGMVGLKFPPIGFKQVSKLNYYEVNVLLPDSLYNEYNWITVDSTTINSGDSLFVEAVDVVPLSKQEEDAYENLDSTATLEKAFKPKGFFTRFIDWEEETSDDGASVSASSSGGSGSSGGDGGKPTPLKDFVSNLRPDARYNRVDAVFAGAVHTRRYADNRLESKVSTGYSFGYEEFSYGAQLSWWPLKKTRRFALYTGYKAETATRYNSDMYSMLLASPPALFGYDDYFDFFRKEGGYAGVSFRPRNSGNIFRLRYRYEDHSTIQYKTSYDIIGSSLSQRPNSYAEDGTLSSVELKFERGDNNHKALGAIGADHLSVSVEQSAKVIGSDWDFTRFKVDMYRRFTTFYERRLIPNVLDFRLNAGTYLGDLPVQENEVLDVAQGMFTPFGAFKTKPFIPYEGASYVGLNAEHNFRSIPLEMVGWRGAAKTGLSIIAFGGIGRTWVKDSQVQNFNTLYGLSPSYTDGWHTEVGVSLSNIFNLFRADVAYRIDEPGFFVGFSIARFF